MSTISSQRRARRVVVVSPLRHLADDRDDQHHLNNTAAARELSNEEQRHTLAKLLGTHRVRATGDRSYKHESRLPGIYIIDGNIWISLYDIMLHPED